ncbi:MAG: hypothetical protein ACTSQF_10910 [Candidatus Heimdallarchaeaceae archaeon]
MIKQVSEKVFKETKGVSYSRLSKLAESPQAYQAALVEEPDSSAITLGTAVDMLLTQPDQFHEGIYVMTTSKPNAEAMLTYCTRLVESGGNTAVAYGASGYKISPDAVHKKFEKEGRTYYDAVMAARGKKIIDVDEMFKANQIVSTLQSNIYTKKYFVPEGGVELIFQPRILWNMMYHSLLHEGKSNIVQAKSVLDVIRIDHKTKTIQPIDLKTGAESFMKSYWRYKRYLQGAMYNTAVWKAMENIDSDYVIENMRFVFADTNLRYPPMIYQMTDRDLEVGTFGTQYKTITENRETTIAYLDDRWKVKGYAQLAAELEWHQKMDKWEYSYDVYQRNGEVDIDAFTFKF